MRKKAQKGRITARRALIREIVRSNVIKDLLSLYNILLRDFDTNVSFQTLGVDLEAAKVYKIDGQYQYRPAGDPRPVALNSDWPPIECATLGF